MPSGDVQERKTMGTSSSMITFMEDRIGPEFLLVRHPAKAHHYMLGSMLSDGGTDDTGKTVLVSHAGSTIASRLVPSVTDDSFAGDLLDWPKMGPAITDIIGSGWNAGGQVQAKCFPVEFDVSAEAVHFDGRWFNHCRLYSIDEQHFWKRLKGKKLEQDAPGIQGKTRFFIITEAYVAKSVGQLQQGGIDASVNIGLAQTSTDEGASAGVRLAYQHANHQIYKQIGEAALAFKIVEVKFDMHGIIQDMNLVQNPRHHYTVLPQIGNKPAPTSPKKTECV